MAYRVKLSDRAESDLEALFAHIGAASSALASAWFESLERAVSSLREHPKRCPTARDAPALRHLLFGSGRDVYRILFKVDEARAWVTVVHVRHGARAPLKPRKTRR